MKLPLAPSLAGLLSAAILSGCAGGSGTTSTASNAGRWVMRVDRTLDQKEQPSSPQENLSADAYRDAPPADRWEVSIENGHVVIVALQPSLASQTPSRFEGHEVTGAGGTVIAGERRFELDQGAFAGGRFVIRGDDAELTMFGSGVPIVMSERGKLLSR